MGANMLKTATCQGLLALKELISTLSHFVDECKMLL